MNPSSLNDSTNSETLLNQIILEYLKEQKRKRTLRWIKRVFWITLIGFGLYMLMAIQKDDLISTSKPHIGLVDVNGTILEGQPAGADSFGKGLAKAYENKALKALILRIDSPGGSPVQADYMYNLVRYYRKKHPDIKTYAVCVDTCASAAYYVATATDAIYANPSSLVGSIGVIYSGFGFVDAMQKLGVSRRLHTAGLNKGFMDQFSPVNPAQEKNLQAMLDVIHKQFIAKVKKGRGDRLKIDDDTFSGLVWTGSQAKERGLIDGFASSGQLARNVIKIDQVIDYTDKQSVLTQVSKSFGTALVNQLPIMLGLQHGLSMTEL